MSGLSLHVAFDWQPAGRVTRVADALAFPRVGAGPRVYRFAGGGAAYVGGAVNLARRLQGYRTSG